MSSQTASPISHLPVAANGKDASQQRAYLYSFLLIFAYALAILLPVGIVFYFGKRDRDPFVYQLGLSAALVGIAILVMQFVLASRPKWAERHYGMDMVYRFHRSMAIFAAFLLLAHPLLLAVGKQRWPLLYSLHVTWYIWLGRAALATLILQILFSIGRTRLKSEYQGWKRTHNFLAVSLITLGLLHSWNAGGDLKLPEMRLLWVLYAIVMVLAYGWHKAARPKKLAKQPYRVVSVQQESKDVWTLSFTPESGNPAPHYLPGQYHYLTLWRDGKPLEEHPFTISSSPTDQKHISSTIKASGDFTKQINKTTVGEKATIDGAYGRFSYLLHPEEQELVFLAGGVGITPLMSMLRHIRDIRAQKSVALLYSSKTEEDIIFKQELAAMNNDPECLVRVIHILSRPGKEWLGATGRIDGKLIKAQCGGGAEKGYYICGPQPMIESTARALSEMGVTPQRIHFEQFEL